MRGNEPAPRTGCTAAASTLLLASRSDCASGYVTVPVGLFVQVARLRVRKLVDSAAALDGEVAPDLRGRTEAELLDQAARRLEAVVGILRRDAARHHVPCIQVIKSSVCH